MQLVLCKYFQFSNVQNFIKLECIAGKGVLGFLIAMWLICRVGFFCGWGGGLGRGGV